MAMLNGNTPLGSGFRPLAEINVTPLVDVMLVLLVIFMITAPLLASGLKVDLPQASIARPLDQKRPVQLTITRDGRVSVGGDEIQLEALVAHVRAATGNDPNATIQMRGDRETPFGIVVTIMDRLAAEGLTRIAIVADPASKMSPAATEPATYTSSVPETTATP